MNDFTVTEFIKELERYKNEIGCDGNRIGAHNLKSSIRFRISNEDLNFDAELESIEASQLFGCGCWDGIIFNIRLKNEC